MIEMDGVATDSRHPRADPARPAHAAPTRPARAERRAERAEQRRTDLVLAAYDLVITRGFRAIGVNDIAQAAQVSHGTFYNYFDNKRDILDAVIDHCFDLLRDRLLGPEGDGRPESLEEFCDRYARVIDRCFELVATEPGLVNFFLLEASSIDDRVIDRCLHNARRYGVEAVARVSHGIGRGYLDPALDVDIAGEVLMSVLVSALLAALRGSSEGLTQDRVRTQLVGFLASALGAQS
ncbi:TetR/AcrR family transcriptional regulator [Nocardia sp. 2]|uniref:TetR/AcrR family transcriptional regulator n=1 Tax=Nocardia acididurans TaxID=2802282 RepID=A0ABS1M2Q3_9NOCA|nr:TetR/AcrR family transcriptional regulator [Nocardia acididurans]MBL1074109.1 TetR/AcrR family transcriptional regulator [Nocardia acididurans]